MDKLQLLDKVNSLQTIDKSQLISWIKSMPNSESRPSPTTNKIGDVYMHSIFKHPYVLLAKRGEVWLCGLLTSSSDCCEILEQGQSRFFSTSYFTKSLFTITNVQGNFLGVYENKKHLKKVFDSLKKILK